MSLRSPGSVRRVVCLRREVEAIELRRLVAAAAALRRRCSGRRSARSSPCDTGSPPSVSGSGSASGARDAEDLRRVGAGAAVRDEHLAPRRVPRHEAMAAKVGVARDRAGDARRHRRDALDDEVGVGNDDVGGRRLRRRQRCAGTEQDGHRTGRGALRSADRSEEHRREKGRRLDGGALIVMPRGRAGAARDASVRRGPASSAGCRRWPTRGCRRPA